MKKGIPLVSAAAGKMWPPQYSALAKHGFLQSFQHLLWNSFTTLSITIKQT